MGIFSADEDVSSISEVPAKKRPRFQPAPRSENEREENNQIFQDFEKNLSLNIQSLKRRRIEQSESSNNETNDETNEETNNETNDDHQDQNDLEQNENSSNSYHILTMSGGGLAHGFIKKAEWKLTVDGVTFILWKIRFHRNSKYEATEHHYVIEIQLNDDKNGDRPLSSIVDDGLFEGLREVLEKMEKEFKYKHERFLLKLTHKGIDDGIRGKLWSFDTNFEDIRKFYTDQLDHILTSKKGLKIDDTFKVWIHVFNDEHAEEEEERIKAKMYVLKIFIFYIVINTEYFPSTSW